MNVTAPRMLAVVVSIVVAAAIVAGVVILGSPSEERVRRLDRRRVADLQGMRTAIDFFHSSSGRLPASLDELSSQPGVRVSSDPVTTEPYRYRPLDANAFELCATFERPSESQRSSGVDIWQHPAGPHCVTLKVEKRSQ